MHSARELKCIFWQPWTRAELMGVKNALEFTGRVLGPWTRPLNSGSGNRPLMPYHHQSTDGKWQADAFIDTIITRNAAKLDEFHPIQLTKLIASIGSDHLTILLRTVCQVTWCLFPPTSSEYIVMAQVTWCPFPPTSSEYIVMAQNC